MPDAADFRCLLPADVAVATARPEDSVGDLAPREEALVARASQRRKAHFRGGRWCAHRALEAAGGPPDPIGAGPRGEPLWPPGFVGSITHSDLLYAAAVGSATRYIGIGIDVESLRRRTEAIRRMTCTEAELAWADARGDDADRWLLMVFSAKESFFKCWFPARRTVPTYEAVHVDVDPDTSTFVATIGDLQLSGRFAFTGSLVATAITWPRETP